MAKDKQTESSKPSRAAVHKGSCHCGAVRYRAEVDASHGSRCNCTICTKVSQLGGIVKPEAFELLMGSENITQYVWGHNTSVRSFCKTCGVHCFGMGHLAELGGDFVSINFNTLDDVDSVDVKVVYWDGRHDNWHAGPRERPWPIASEGGTDSAA